jgi:hypothetical protein
LVNPYFPAFRYDFNGDGLISKEDVRIVLSYIPFKRDVTPESTADKLSSMSIQGEAKKQKEGLYEQEEGKVLEYKDRVTDQEEIKNFVNMVFDSTPSTAPV